MVPRCRIAGLRNCGIAGLRSQLDRGGFDRSTIRDSPIPHPRNSGFRPGIDADGDDGNLGGLLAALGLVK